MDDAGAVRPVEGVGDLDREAQRLVERQRPASRSRSASVSPSRYSMTRKSMPSSRPTSWSVQMCGWFRLRDRPRFALEAVRAVAVGGDVRRQDLDRDRAIEAGVARAVDLAHAARADGRRRFVGTEAGSGGEGHRERNYSGFDDARSKAAT